MYCRIISSLFAVDQFKKNYPVSILTNAAQRLARSLSYASRIVLRRITVCRWRTHGHRKCLHSIFLAEILHTKDLQICVPVLYLDPTKKADQCAQNVDDTEIAANFAMDLTWIIRAVFTCIREVRLKPTTEKCFLRITQVEFFDWNISLQAFSPQVQKFRTFAANSYFQYHKKHCFVTPGSVKFYGNCISRWLKNLHRSKSCLKQEC